MIGIRTFPIFIRITVAALWRIYTSLPQSQTIHLLSTLLLYTPPIFSASLLFFYQLMHMHKLVEKLLIPRGFFGNASDVV